MNRQFGTQRHHHDLRPVRSFVSLHIYTSTHTMRYRLVEGQEGSRRAALSIADASSSLLQVPRTEVPFGYTTADMLRPEVDARTSMDEGRSIDCVVVVVVVMA